ncbi:hypothetical protein BCR43DRAFT_350468 [Syncephalastrum racemosum]|uniref:F-box domain-containing protein n=1 Tax=Syncephalastrum racemosum TaxID=13706 RepID=A0A1X2H7F2_SYNRA|nr:hypothetical protein BCR43DRAFT_350468 [Syncephalastrum racemosum]
MLQTDLEDFLEKFPTEILTPIFGTLHFKDRVECAKVCRRWRACLLNMPAVWSTIALDTAKHHQDANFLSGSQSCYLERVLERGHVRAFSLKGPGPGIMSALGLLGEEGCKSIEKLALEAEPVWDLPGLDAVIFRRICGPGLRDLKLVDIGLPADDDSWSLLFSFLTWEASIRLPLPQMLPQCPNLRLLQVDEGQITQSTLMTLTRQPCVWCPALQVLRITSQSLSSLSTDISYRVRNDTPGLKNLEIQGETLALSGQTAGKLIMQNYHTLEHLAFWLSTSDTQDNPSSARDLSQYVHSLADLLPLETFRLRGGSSGSRLLDCLAPKCPFLRKLELVSVYLNQHVLLRFLAACSQLTEVYMRSVSRDGEDGSYSHTPVSKVHSLPFLEKLEIIGCSALRRDFFQYLPQLDCLSSFILVSFMRVYGYDLEEFFASKTPNLEYAYLTKNLGISRQVIESLSQLPRLKVVRCREFPEEERRILLQSGIEVIY